MTAFEIVLYFGGAYVSGFCLGFSVYSWRRFTDSI